MNECVPRQASDSHQGAGYACLKAARPFIEAAYHLIEARAKLVRYLPKSMTQDSALGMLLHLFIGEFENRDLCVKQLALSSGDTHATAIRVINDLESSGMIERRSDKSDHRRTIIRLSSLGRSAIMNGLEPLAAPRPDILMPKA